MLADQCEQSDDENAPEQVLTEEEAEIEEPRGAQQPLTRIRRERQFERPEQQCKKEKADRDRERHRDDLDRRLRQAFGSPSQDCGSRFPWSLPRRSCSRKKLVESRAVANREIPISRSDSSNQIGCEWTCSKISVIPSEVSTISDRHS